MLDFFLKIRKTIFGSVKPSLYILLAFFLILLLVEINPLSKPADILLFNSISKHTQSKTEYKKVSVVTIDEESRASNLVNNSDLINEILKEKPKDLLFLTHGSGLGDCSELVDDVTYVLADDKVNEGCIPVISKNKKQFYFHSYLDATGSMADLVVDTNKVMHVNKKIPILNIKTMLVGKNLTYNEAQKIDSKMNLSTETIPVFSHVFIENKTMFQGKIKGRVVFVDNISHSQSKNAAHLAKIYSASEEGQILQEAKGGFYYAFLLFLFLQIGVAVYYCSFAVGCFIIGSGLLEVALASYISIKFFSQKAPFANSYFLIVFSVMLFQVFKRRKIEKEIKSIAKLIHHNGDWGLQAKSKNTFDVEEAISSIKKSLDLCSVTVLSKSKKKTKKVYNVSDIDSFDFIELVNSSHQRFFKREEEVSGEVIENFVYSSLTKGRVNTVVLSRKKKSESSVLGKDFIKKVSSDILQKINLLDGDESSPMNMADSKQFGYTMGSIKRLLRLNRELRVSLNSVSVPKATYNIFTENIYKNNEFIELLSDIGPSLAQKSIIEVLLQITDQSREEILSHYNRLIENEKRVEFYGEIGSVDYSGEKESTPVRAVLKLVESKGFSIKNSVYRSISLELYPDKKHNLLSMGQHKAKKSIKSQVLSKPVEPSLESKPMEAAVAQGSSSDVNELFGDKPKVDISGHFVASAKALLEEKEVSIKKAGAPFEAAVSGPILEFFEALWQNICKDVKPLSSVTIEVSENQKIQGLRVMYKAMGAFDLNTMISGSPFYNQQCSFLKENGIRLLQTKTGDSVEFYIIKNISNSQQMAS